METLLGRGKDGLQLLGVDAHWIPKSSAAQDFPFSRVIRLLDQGGILRRVGEDSGGHQKIPREWSRGSLPTSHDQMKQVLRLSAMDLKQAVACRADEALKKKKISLKEFKNKLLKIGQDELHIDKQLKRYYVEAERNHQLRTSSETLPTIMGYLRFLVAMQRIFLGLKNSLSPIDFKMLLNDLHYWSQIPQNIEGLVCDGTWVEQPRTIRFGDEEFTVSDRVYQETKKYLDWISRYGALQKREEIEDFASLVCDRLINPRTTQAV
jgi:hypothetical protein